MQPPCSRIHTVVKRQQIIQNKNLHAFDTIKSKLCGKEIDIRQTKSRQFQDVSVCCALRSVCLWEMNSWVDSGDSVDCRGIEKKTFTSFSQIKLVYFLHTKNMTRDRAAQQSRTPARCTIEKKMMWWMNEWNKNAYQICFQIMRTMRMRLSANQKVKHNNN